MRSLSCSSKTQQSSETVNQFSTKVSYKSTASHNATITSIETNDEYLIITVAPTSDQGIYLSEHTKLVSQDEGGRRYFVIKKEEIIVTDPDIDGGSKICQKLYFRKFASRIHSFDFINADNVNFYGVEAFIDEEPMTLWNKSMDYGKVIKTIDNPAFLAKSGVLDLTKIEMGQNYTALTFQIEMKGSNDKFIIPTNSCIYDSNTGKEFYVREAKGIDFGQWIEETEQGLLAYTLYFPAMSPEVKTLNFKENNTGGTEIIRGIEL